MVCKIIFMLHLHVLHLKDTEDLLLLATQKVKIVKPSTTITELVVVWSLCSICTSVTKSKAVVLYNTSCFLLYPCKE